MQYDALAIAANAAQLYYLYDNGYLPRNHDRLFLTWRYWPDGVTEVDMWGHQPIYWTTPDRHEELS